MQREKQQCVCWQTGQVSSGFHKRFVGGVKDETEFHSLEPAYVTLEQRARLGRVLGTQLSGFQGLPLRSM